ncbi:MFS transporter [Leptolyngbya sp. NIES-2104]|uniref:MFS transporter n=1 Tax=Leptolyngbya sp. NIES-2104 TaxID=1552121 RepID=UPI0006EC8D4C|nr:MFS transporter [Leptolyngbya sp. NIES-2104]GAP95818.1 major facilitator family transporter [Leptolyngbya sp. NIES-2104]
MSTFAKLSAQTKQNLGVLFTAGLLFWASLASLLPTLPLYVKSIGAPDSQLGIVMASFAIGLLLFRPQAGKMADQQGRKIVLLIGISAATIAPVCHLLTQSIPILMIVRAFHGISIAAFTTAYSSLVVDIAPPDNRGELIGYMSLVNPIGMALGPAIGGYLQEFTSYAPVFVLSSILGMISMTCAMFVKAPPLQHQQQNQASDKLFWRLLLTDRIRIPTVTMLLVGVAFGAIATFVPLHIKEANVGLNSGLFYTAAAVTSFMTRFVSGKASDRYGRGRFITAGLLSYAISLIVLALANSAPLFLLAGALEGVGGGTFLPIMIALVADRCQPYERGRIFGLFVGGFDVGIALAGPILGSVASAIGYRGLYAVAAVVAFSALIVFMTLSSKSVAHSFRFALGYGKDLYAIPKDELLIKA